MSDALLRIEARAIAEQLGVGTAPQPSVDRVADRLIRIHREATEQAYAEGRDAALRPFEELFADGPDTVCRTVYRTGTVEYGIECVEVPLDKLRAAFDAAGGSLT